MLLQLPKVTLLGIDCIGTRRLLDALHDSIRFIDFASVVMVTSPENAKELAGRAGPVKLVQRRQTGRIDYEVDALTLAESVTNTSHVLYMEWDARVANWSAWDPSWLQYDYIGAPWPRHYTNGWPVCDASNCVGNGGFSLRSRRFYTLCKEAAIQLEDNAGMLVHDAWACRTLRPWLERNGIKFAPPEVAHRFSCENHYYSGQFGIHGKATFKMNGFPL